MISTVGFFSMVIVTGANSKYKTLQEVIAAAKQSPGKLNIGTITPGGTQHLAGELFRSSAGMDALVVPHKTTGEVVVGVRNGTLDVGVDFIAPLTFTLLLATALKTHLDLGVSGIAIGMALLCLVVQAGSLTLPVAVITAACAGAWMLQSKGTLT